MMAAARRRGGGEDRRWWSTAHVVGGEATRKTDAYYFDTCVPRQQSAAGRYLEGSLGGLILAVTLSSL